jgi:hypothetical protein
MSEQPVARVEIRTTRGGFSYEAAIGAALVARELAGAPGPEPMPADLRPEGELELEAG